MQLNKFLGVVVSQSEFSECEALLLKTFKNAQKWAKSEFSCSLLRKLIRLTDRISTDGQLKICEYENV